MTDLVTENIETYFLFIRRGTRDRNKSVGLMPYLFESFPAFYADLVRSRLYIN